MDSTNKKENFEKDTPISNIVSDLRSKKIERMRRYGSNDDLKLLADIALVPMISKETWKHNGRSVELSTLTTVADEAFALLTMENNVDEWIKLKVNGKDSAVKGENTKYTSPGKNKRDGTKKGWTLEGKERYNDIYDAIALERRTQRSKDKEVWMMREWAKEGSVKRKRIVAVNSEEVMRELERERKESEFVPRNGFLD